MLIVENVVVTPNPNALKFVVNGILLVRETRYFKNAKAAQKDSLAKIIFEINGVVSVFYTDRFITIEKENNSDWNYVQKEIIRTLHKFDKELIPHEENVKTLVSGKDYMTLQKIVKIIDERIKPLLAGDGGGLDILELSGNELKIGFMGACGSCPSSIHGTLNAIENLLRHEINPLINVVSTQQ